MKRVVIIEDETAAAVNLRALLAQTCPGCEVVATLESIAESVEWLGANPSPDLVFMDIHLADGDAFRIFPKVEITAPIIFTTAYDQYALNAFKVNSVDYLLKPIKAEELSAALRKLERLTGGERADYNRRVAELAIRPDHTFLIHLRDKLIPLPGSEIAFCHTLNERVSAYTHDGRKYPIDGSLDAVMGLLDDRRFFRANRQFVVSRAAVGDISVWFGSRLQLALTVPVPERIVISKARVPEFKRWLRSAPEEE